MSHPTFNIDVHYLTRVEGHGNIKVDVKNGEVKECVWEIPEAPRFFEAMVRGRSWNEVATITSRICGICSIAHTFASLKATEAAMGIQLSKQTLKLRKLLLHAENLQSHVLHIGYLALPDFAGVKSVIPLASSHTQEVLTVVRLHRLANELCDLVGGRTTHPNTTVVNGFTRLPDAKRLKEFQDKCKNSFGDLKAVATLLKALSKNIPAFERETEYIGLTSKEEYAIYDGQIGSTDTGVHPVDEYRTIVNEYIVPQSTAKYCKHNRDAYLVGALARFNLNYDQLSPVAKEIAADLGLKAPCYNPFMNTVAQLVECVYSVEDCIRLIDEVLADGLKEEDRSFAIKAGRGVGVVEAPRGILIHDYTYDDKGICREANCVIPTNQNHANIQKDMEALLPGIMNKSKEEITLHLEMLGRAYDPCISCSTHLLKVEFV